MNAQEGEHANARAEDVGSAKGCVMCEWGSE